jgi:hypothetical protein
MKIDPFYLLSGILADSAPTIFLMSMGSPVGLSTIMGVAHLPKSK